MRKTKTYNISNLKPFTKANASYYGARGGFASGKSKLNKKIQITKMQIGLIYLDLEKYKSRQRFYNKDYAFIKEQLHYYKIYQNRLNKLINKYDKKYGLYREQTIEF